MTDLNTFVEKQLKAFTHQVLNEYTTQKYELFGRELFASKLITLAATRLCDRNTGIRICERVLTAHAEEEKGTHVTNTMLKYSRTY